MKTLTSPVSTEAAAEQSGWTELYDFYLKSSVTGPFGTTDTLRLTILPGGLSFFTPKISPEPTGTQGNAASYLEWNLKRELIHGASKFTNDKISIAASNVTGEWATMLAAIEWRDTPVIIRKVPTTNAAPTADDCVTIFAGQIDSARTSLDQIQFSCSNDLANLATTAPRENMHANCRFNWADDLCTAIRFLAENYKAKTVGSGSTTVKIKSADFTEDTAANYEDDVEYFVTPAGWDGATDLVSKTAHGLVADQLIQWVGTGPPSCSFIAYYYVITPTANHFAIALTPGGGAIDLVSIGSGFISAYRRFGTDLVNALADGNITASSEFVGWTNESVAVNGGGAVSYYFQHGSHMLSENDPVTFSAGTMPAPLIAGTVYYCRVYTKSVFGVKATSNGAVIYITTGGSAVLFSTTPSYGVAKVKSRYDSWWRFTTAADWGTKTQGYWQIPDAQAGLANAALKPYIQFDFGSAKTPRTWRLSSAPGLKLEELPRLLVFFSSTDAATWTHEQYFEMPPRGGILFDCLIPKASTARYWRICVRTRWAESLFFSLLNKVFAYEESRHWWTTGQVTFDAGTATVALRGVTRMVLESYTGEIIVPPLPAVPANGDTFVIERGCPRTWNACNERRNWENFGGFLDLPNQTVIR